MNTKLVFMLQLTEHKSVSQLLYALKAIDSTLYFAYNLWHFICKTFCLFYNSNEKQEKLKPNSKPFNEKLLVSFLKEMNANLFNSWIRLRGRGITK